MSAPPQLSNAQLAKLAGMVQDLLRRGPGAVPPGAGGGAPPPLPVSTLPPTVAPYGQQDMYTQGPEEKSSKKKKSKSKKKKKHGDGDGGDDGGGSAPPSGGGGGWQKATATWYSSYPECCHDKKADQSECDDYSGCKYEGMFAAFDGKKDKGWVESNNLVAFYEAPNSKNRKEWDKKWKNKKLRIRNPKTGKTMDVTVVDTCDDGDCSGCCSKNANKNGGHLVDLEKNTAKRFYDGKVQDMASIEWQVIG